MATNKQFTTSVRQTTVLGRRTTATNQSAKQVQVNYKLMNKENGKKLFRKSFWAIDRGDIYIFYNVLMASAITIHYFEFIRLRNIVVCR